MSSFFKCRVKTNPVLTFSLKIFPVKNGKLLMALKNAMCPILAE